MDTTMGRARALSAGKVVLGIGAAAVLIALAVFAGSSTAATTAGLKIGFVGFDSTTVAAQREAVAAKSAMTKAGWDVSLQDPAGDASKANGICQQYVTQQVDAIVVDVFQGPQMAQCLTSAKSANIPVFFVASVLASGMAGAVSTSTSIPINKMFVQSLRGKKNVNILALQFSPGAPCLARQKAMDAEIKRVGLDVKIQRHEVKIPGQVPDSQAATTAWLNAHPASAGQTLAIWSCFSDAALGATAALRQANRKVPQYTWDLTKQIVPLLKNRTIAATSISDANKLGQQLVAMINAYRAGNKTPKQVESPALVLTRKNIAAYVAHNKVA